MTRLEAGQTRDQPEREKTRQCRNPDVAGLMTRLGHGGVDGVEGGDQAAAEFVPGLGQAGTRAARDEQGQRQRLLQFPQQVGDRRGAYAQDT